MREATLLERATSGVLDVVVFSIASLALSVILVLTADSLFSYIFRTSELIAITIAFVVAMHIILEGRGGTPGKMFLGMSVVDKNRQAIGAFRALVRLVLKIVSLALLGAGYWMIPLKGISMHDMIVKTKVMKR